MPPYRTAEQVKKYDIFKIVTFGILVILLLLGAAYFRPVESPPAAVQITSEPTAAALPATSAAATGAETDLTPTANVALSATEEAIPLPTTSEAEANAGAELTPTTDSTTAATEEVTFLPATSEAATEVSTPDANSSNVATEEAIAPTELAAPTLDLPGNELTAGQVSLTGTGEPGVDVEIVVEGQVVGKTTVGSDGQWSFAADLPDAGDYEVSVQQVDADGQVLAASEPAALTVAASAPTASAPMLDSPGTDVAAGQVMLTGGGEPGSQIQVIVDGEPVGKATVDNQGKWSLPIELPDPGDHNISVQSVDDSGTGGAISQTMTVTVGEAAAGLAIPTVDLPGTELTSGNVTLTGTGEPGSEVQVLVDGQPVGKVTVDSEGKWNLPTELAAAGEHEVRVQSVDDSGEIVAASDNVQLTVVEEAAVAEEPAAPAEEDGEAYIVQADDWLSKLADKFYGDIFAYPTIVDATNAKAKEDSSFDIVTNPDLIEIGQKLWIPKAAP
jgi:hypothetical protein